MKDTDVSRYGFIQTDNGEISFFSEGHTFTFFKKVEDPFENVTVKNTVEGFLVGDTATGHKIAIYTNDGITITSGISKINTFAYIVSKGNFSPIDDHEYDGIEFEGGTLNHLFLRRAIDFEWNTEGSHTITPIRNYKDYKFDVEGITFDMTIGNSFSVRHSDDGIEVRDTDVKLSFKFSKKQKLANLLKVVTVIKKVLSFMTFRENVGFGTINLLLQDNEIQRPITIANLFLRQDYELETKRYGECITFDDLGDCIKNLIILFYENNENKPSYMLGFIPENSKKVGSISNTDVKEICSALECELKFIKDINGDNNKDLNDLIDDVKNIVKQHRKGQNKLSDKAYSMIFGSIKNWSMSASEKITLLYKRYEKALLCLNDSEINIGEAEINQFVKYRNYITHGSYRVLNMEVAITAYVLSGLVYCCILSRIGLEQQKILELCHYRKIIH